MHAFLTRESSRLYDNWLGGLLLTDYNDYFDMLLFSIILQYYIRPDDLDSLSLLLFILQYCLFIIMFYAA